MPIAPCDPAWWQDAELRRGQCRGVCEQLTAAGLAPRVMVDASHGNSSKKPENQPLVTAAIGAQIEAGSTRVSGVIG